MRHLPAEMDGGAYPEVIHSDREGCVSRCYPEPRRTQQTCAHEQSPLFNDRPLPIREVPLVPRTALSEALWRHRNDSNHAHHSFESSPFAVV
eukprot:1192051-Prorocentrum_minimum.AAC.6